MSKCKLPDHEEHEGNCVTCYVNSDNPGDANEYVKVDNEHTIDLALMAKQASADFHEQFINSPFDKYYMGFVAGFQKAMRLAEEDDKREVCKTNLPEADSATPIMDGDRVAFLVRKECVECGDTHYVPDSDSCAFCVLRAGNLCLRQQLAELLVIQEQAEKVSNDDVEK